MGRFYYTFVACYEVQRTLAIFRGQRDLFPVSDLIYALQVTCHTLHQACDLKIEIRGYLKIAPLHHIARDLSAKRLIAASKSFGEFQRTSYRYSSCTRIRNY